MYNELLKNIYIARFFLEDNKNYNSGDFTWRVSDCEELSGGYSQEMMGLVLGGFKQISM